MRMLAATPRKDQKVNRPVNILVLMTNHLETRIRDIDAPDFRAMINGLCHCTGFSEEEFTNGTLRFMLMAILKESSHCLSDKYLPVSGILTQKVGSLPHGSVVYGICMELADLNKIQIETIDGKKVLAFIKACSKGLCPSLKKAAKLGRNQLRHISQTQLIMQRRQNGSL